jgi:hypothetical protein
LSPSVKPNYSSFIVGGWIKILASTKLYRIN